MTDLTGVFGKPFKYQVAAFRLRLADLRDTKTWRDVWQAGHDRAFMVAGATGADLLADLAAAVDKGISEGTTLETFRKDFRRIVEKRGWHGWTGEGTKKGEAWRTRVIYNTNLSVSYHAGRHAQLVKAGHKFWVYFHGNAREPRLQHLGWDGLILPSGAPAPAPWSKPAALPTPRRAPRPPRAICCPPMWTTSPTRSSKWPQARPPPTATAPTA